MSSRRLKSDVEHDDLAAPTRGEGEYSIRVASRMTGISAHTLRMWERRYGFPEPARTPGGARRYSAADVTALKLIAKALDMGYRPHEVVGKQRSALERILAEQVVATSQPGGAAPNVGRVIERVEAGEPESVRSEIRAAVAVLGPKRFLTDYAHPLLVAIGEAWAEGRLAVQQEHWTTEVLTTQIRALMAGYEGLEGHPKVLLTTLPDELHSLGLQMVSLYLALSGASARLLGPSTPVQEAAAAALELGVDVVGIGISLSSVGQVTEERLGALLRELPRKVEMWVGGAGAHQLGVDEPQIHRVQSFEAIDRELARWRAVR